ncbi:MAG: hypothetical protein CMJ49_05375 [Planctomycetaceae bacterium]|nr:hypothetical protein [Planctomycetaceae bacterium]
MRALEDKLVARSPAHPPARLRSRVVTDMTMALREERRIGFWRFAAAAAIVVIVGMNLSMSAASATRYPASSALNAQELRSTAAQISDLLPGLSESEARRHALLLHAGAGVVPAPIPSRPPVNLDQYLDF